MPLKTLRRAMSGGPIRFDPLRLSSEEAKGTGDKAPILNTWVEVYKKNAPDAAAAMTATVEAFIASFEASNPTPPPVEGGSDSTPPAPIPLPVETHNDIVQGEVGVRRGMVIRGLGMGYIVARMLDSSSEVEELQSIVARMQRVMEQMQAQQRVMEQMQAQQRTMEQMQAQQEVMEEMQAQQRAMEQIQAQVRLLLRGNASGGDSTSHQQP